MDNAYALWRTFLGELQAGRWQRGYGAYRQSDSYDVTGAACDFLGVRWQQLRTGEYRPRPPARQALRDFRIGHWDPFTMPICVHSLEMRLTQDWERPLRGQMRGDVMRLRTRRMAGAQRRYPRLQSHVPLALLEDRAPWDWTQLAWALKVHLDDLTGGLYTAESPRC